MSEAEFLKFWDDLHNDAAALLTASAPADATRDRAGAALYNRARSSSWSIFRALISKKTSAGKDWLMIANYITQLVRHAAAAAEAQQPQAAQAQPSAKPNPFPDVKGFA